MDTTALANPVAILPCVKCHNPGGKFGYGGSRPARIDGAKFGIQGKVCKTCWQQLYDASRAAANGTKYGVSRLVMVRPCEACGTTGGRACHSRGASAGRPSRYRVVADSGEELRVCYDCRFPAIKSHYPPGIILPGPGSDPDTKEIERRATEERRQWSPLGAGALVEPRYDGPPDREVAAEKARNVARTAIAEARAVELGRKAWQIVLPEPRA